MKSPYPSCPEDADRHTAHLKSGDQKVPATWELIGWPVKFPVRPTTSNPKVGKYFDLKNDGTKWLCIRVSHYGATLHPVGRPSERITISAKAELREVRK